MDCLSKLVGIKNTCSTPVSHSSYYLDDIDITISEIEKYVEKDQLSPTTFVNGKIDFAARSVADMIHQNFNGKYIAFSMLANGRVGYPQENKNTVAPNNKRKGIILDTCNAGSNNKMYVSRLSLFTSHTGNVSVYIYDLIQGRLLDTITVAAVADQIVYADVNKTYKSLQGRLKLAFLYDTTGITSYQTYLASNGCYDCSGSYGTFRVNNYVTSYAATIDLVADEITENFNYISETGGLSVHFNLSCDHENWLCDIGNVVALPILYKAGAEILRFGKDATMRFNSRAGNDEERIQKRLDYLELRFRESMDSILPQIKTPTDSMCFKCNNQIISKVLLP